jgi:hypothetical protein
MMLNNYINHSLDKKNRGIYFKRGKWLLHIISFGAMYIANLAKFGGKIDDLKGGANTTIVFDDKKGASSIEVSSTANIVDNNTYLASFITLLPFIVFFYIYCLYLIPSCFKRDKKRQFWQLMAISLIVFPLIQVGLHYAFVDSLPQLGRHMDEGFLKFTWRTFTGFIGIFFGFTSLLFFMELLEEVRTSKEIKRHESEITQTELNRIKMQMNPSFMAVALDQISALAAAQDDTTPETIVGFADVLRYRLYRSKVDKVFLEEELQQLSNLFKFQNNIHKRDCCILEVEGATDNKGIVPLALINIAEPLINYATNINHEWNLLMYLLCEEDEMQIAVEFSEVGALENDLLLGIKSALDLMFDTDVIFAIENETDNYSIRTCLPLYRNSNASL